MVAEIPNYIDDGRMRDQDQVPLRTFLSDFDRAQPTGRGLPFFSGREKEVNAFRTAANGLLLGRPANATVVVEGPPGAGKSSLLAQFQEDMRRFPPAGNEARRWLPVAMDGSRAESPKAIQEEVDAAIATQLANDVLQAKSPADAHPAPYSSPSPTERLQEMLGGEALLRKLGFTARAAARKGLDRGFGAMGFRLGGEAGNSAESIVTTVRRRAQEWGNWQIVLLVDEAQRISDQGPGCAKGTLEALHLGFMRAPISFCAFGLPGTVAALERAGVSRTTVSYDFRLRGLDDRSSKLVVQRCFDQYGVTHGSAWQEAILERSSNWPQHVASYLNAALTVLRENAPSPEVMGDARKSSLTKAIMAGDESRSSYYDRRIDRLNRENERHERHARTLVAWMAEQSGPVFKDGVMDFLEGPKVNMSETQVDGFLAAAKHAGLLSWKGTSPVEIPIPPFAGHLLGKPLPSISDRFSTSH